MSEAKPNVLVIAGSHGGELCGPVIHQRLLASGRVTPTLRARLLPDGRVDMTPRRELKAPLDLRPADLAGYDVVVYYGENSHDRRDFTDEVEQALRETVHGGTGLVGVHVASWRAEGRLDDLFGGASTACTRPPDGAPQVTRIQWPFAVHVTDREHPITRGVEDFEIIDEHYESTLSPDSHVLLRGDPGLGAQPMAWVRRQGQGRVFHTPLGHRPDEFGLPAFWRLIVQAIDWAAAG